MISDDVLIRAFVETDRMLDLVFIYFIVLIVRCLLFFFFQAEDGIRDIGVTGVQTCALPISPQRSVELPEDNYLGVPAGPATFVAHGWAGLVKKLRPGEHTITVVVADSEGGKIGRASCRERV